MVPCVAQHRLSPVANVMHLVAWSVSFSTVQSIVQATKPVMSAFVRCARDVMQFPA
jgi:hypothetical protein